MATRRGFLRGLLAAGAVSVLPLVSLPSRALRAYRAARRLGVVRDEQEFARLQEVSDKLAHRLDLNRNDALDDFVQAIARRSVRQLDNLGIVVPAPPTLLAADDDAQLTPAQQAEQERLLAAWESDVWTKVRNRS